MICSIFACDANGGIGKHGTLPWDKDPEDFKWFRSHTINNIVVMGKKTWMDPLFPKPLIGRENIVVTSDPSGCEAAHKTTNGIRLENTLRTLELQYPIKTIWIIGGSQLLKSTVHLVDRVYLTKFSKTYDCDVIMDMDSYLRRFTLTSEQSAMGKTFQVYDAKLS